LAHLRAAGPDADANDEELRRIAGPHANLAAEAAQGLLRAGAEPDVDAHVEGLIRRRAEPRAVTPDARKEPGDGALDLVPELPVVRLEERAAQSLLDRFFKEQEQSPDVDVLPVGVGGGGASAPHDRTPVVEHADDVNVLQVEQALI